MVISLSTIMDNLDTRPNQQIIIFVRSPVIHYTWDNGGHYTSYAIHIETNHIAFNLDRSVVRRRYSEFVYLRNLIKGQHPTIVPPSLPSKSYFINKFDLDFIEKRRQGLEVFLQKVMEEDMYVSNRTVHLFVQSSYPVHKIAHMVGGDQDTTYDNDPHLTLTHLIPDEESFSHYSNSDVPDFDILGRIRSNPHSSRSLSSPVCIPRGLTRTQSTVSGGSLIASQTPPRLRSVTREGYGSETGTSESRHFSATVSLSNTIQLPNFLSDIPKKKVSFCGEVTVAQILGKKNNNIGNESD